MRKIEIAEEFLQTCYGGAVSVADVPRAVLMHQLCSNQGDLELWRISVGQPEWVSWTVSINRPANKTGKPRALLSSDACWPQCINMHALQICNDQEVALAWFNRLEIAHDPCSGARQGAFYTQFPNSPNGCLAVWAWSLSATARILRELMPQTKLGVIGHSRGGKAALLAGAVDVQIDAVISHNSGIGGAASLALASAGSENLAQLVSQFPHWMGASVCQPQVQSRLKEVDCMALWARLAPRPLLLLQAQGDAWANPRGTRHVYDNLRSEWALAQSSLALIERQGGHPMQPADWLAAAQFMCIDHPAWQ